MDLRNVVFGFIQRLDYSSTVALCTIGSSLSVRLRTICLVCPTDGFSIVKSYNEIWHDCLRTTIAFRV